MIEEYIKIEVECNIAVSDNIITNDIIPKSIEFYDNELTNWIVKNDIIKRFKIAGLQININSPPKDFISLLLPSIKFGGHI